ncbi:MAG TPA: histidine kinase [Candidatus Cloacimonadota bacterium]|nr:histidine kinase [Candidatus Cloacimonadota bacterium]
MDSEKLTLLNWWAMVRWFMVVVLFSIGLLHISFQELMVENVLFFLVFGGIVGLNLLFQLQSRAQVKWVVVFQVLLDILFATIVVHLTGGLNSFFVWVYLIGVITAALTIPQNGGLLAGLTGTFSLLILVLLYKNGVLSPTQSSEMDIAGSTVYLLSYTGLFCGVALIASYLSDQLRIQGQLQKAQKESLARITELTEMKNQLDTLLPILRNVAHIDHDINTPLCVITLSLGRVKRYANEYKNEGLEKTNNEVTEAVNKISQILQRLYELKQHPLLDYYEQQKKQALFGTEGVTSPPSNEEIDQVKSPTRPDGESETPVTPYTARSGEDK